MTSFRRWFLAALAASTAKAEAVQKSDLQLPLSAVVYQAEVKEIFVTSYEAYQKYAWGYDDLLPVSETYYDGRNGWGASIADAMSTMWIMGLTDWFEQAVDHTANTDFTISHTPDTVSLFETTIRYIGGFLSAYELSGEKYPVLVEKAQDLADLMAYA
ncbi:glycoside hydrolase [Suillus occidentalis]|nr:glycoside hydrolase [Suillus occidentalis]